MFFKGSEDTAEVDKINFLENWLTFFKLCDIPPDMLRFRSHEELVKQIYRDRKPLVAWIRYNSGSSQDGEDVLQESIIVYLRLLDEGKIKDDSNPMAMVTLIAKRYWLSQLRRAKKDVPIDVEMDLPGEIEMNFDHFTERENDYRHLETALQSIGDKCRELLRLFYYNNSGLREIAQKLGFRNEHVAKSMKFKCLEKVRAIVTNIKS